MTTVTDRSNIDAPVGETPASGIRVPERLDVKAIRQRLGLTQTAFARRYGLSLGSIRNWEQGCRQPDDFDIVLASRNHDIFKVSNAR